MKLTANEFSQLKHKRLTLLGMSGVGKTHLAKLLGEAQWFHYSGDYRIGSKYLNQPILDNIKHRMRCDAWLKTLLNQHSIDITNCISVNNLSSVAAFLGKVGNPNQAGLPINEFLQRQALHRQAEMRAMLDVPQFIAKAQQRGIAHFINDAGGSLCELEDEKIYQNLAQHTIILYIKASKNNQSALIQRAQTCPKPLYYQPNFLHAQLTIYLQKHKFNYVAQIDPEDFVRWIFPKLIAHRLPKYARIADTYGYTVESEALYRCKNSAQVLALIGSVIAQQQKSLRCHS